MDQVCRVINRWDEYLVKFVQPDIERLNGAQREKGLLHNGEARNLQYLR